MPRRELPDSHLIRFRTRPVDLEVLSERDWAAEFVLSEHGLHAWRPTEGQLERMARRLKLRATLLANAVSRRAWPAHLSLTDEPAITADSEAGTRVCYVQISGVLGFDAP